MEIDARTPSEFPARDLETFCTLVMLGGEFAALGLRQRVLRSRRLVLARDGDTVTGTAGLKHLAAEGAKEVLQPALGCPRC